jgi:hypothetical protein
MASNETIIRFGSDFSHSEYVVPMAKIKLYNEKGGEPPGEAGGPVTMYIRMGGTFSTSIRAAYDDAQGIFGTPFTTDQSILSKVGDVGLIQALQTQITRAAVGAGGAIASAGLSGRQQIEFLSRVFLSNFQQVVYRGPIFRMFTLPFVMKPTDLQEAQRMRTIILTLKRASVPKVGNYTTTNFQEAIALIAAGQAPSNFIDDRIEQLRGVLAQSATSENQEELNDAKFQLAELERVDDLSRSSLISKETSITFGYPDVCEFELVLVKGNAGGAVTSEITSVFKSKKCVIEAITTDYGSSNKMTFFDQSSKFPNEYYPTEVSLTLNLKELEFQTDTSISQIGYDTRYTIL